MSKQLSIFDLPHIRRPLPLGYVRDGESLKGDMIPFSELDKYVNQQVLLEMPRESAVDYKVIIITKYAHDSENVYEWNDGRSRVCGQCDRVWFSDDNRTHKTNASTTEIACSNGRFSGGRYPECMYEIRR